MTVFLYVLAALTLLEIVLIAAKLVAYRRRGR